MRRAGKAGLGFTQLIHRQDVTLNPTALFGPNSQHLATTA